MYLLRTSQIFDPKINLAVEEFVVRNLDLDDDILFLYRNNPSVIIGKNQNPFEEVNIESLFSQKIELFRRISGGGAVYHDLGNINFSYISKNIKDNFNNYKNFLSPIIDLLNKMGVPAEINSRNDIIVNNLKISGNAQFTTRGKMFSHGTLLFDSDLQKIESLLNIKTHTVYSKSTKSVRSHVANISDYIPKPMKIDFFLDELVHCITEYFGYSGDIIPDPKQWAEINRLVNEKYNNWEWNWGKTPKFIVQLSHPDSQELININIIDGQIDTGNNAEMDSFGQLLKYLNGIRYWKPEIKRMIDGYNKINNREKILMLNCIFPFF